MGDLLLVRHGESDWSRSGRHTGWTEVPLTEHGWEEARRPVPWVRSHRIGARSSARRSGRGRRRSWGVGVPASTSIRGWVPLLGEGLRRVRGVTTVEIQRERPGWFLFTDGVAPGPPAHPGESPEQVGERADRVLARWNVRPPA
ncbi:histidine phosphatase family protein [Streptomyces sp. DT2A-34]|uniref:histidine phosphatase family protein n=1 Tax=Streptomyces sp. DT2A-34 TaxID=3051182 RepID=UPI003463E2B5